MKPSEFILASLEPMVASDSFNALVDMIRDMDLEITDITLA